MWIPKVVLGTVLAFGISAVPTFAQTAAPATTQPSKRDNVMEMQRMLKDKGYYSGEIDGIIGPHTRAALKEYQKSEKLTASGRYTRETAEHLGLATAGDQYPADYFEDAGAAIAAEYSKGASDVAKGTKGAGHELKKGEITSGAVEFGKGVGGGAKAVGKGTAKAAKEAGKGVKDAFDGKDKKDKGDKGQD